MSNISEQRQQKILKELRIHHYMTIYELVDLLHYSESTIKRDLNSLAENGLIRRTRGGAFLVDEKSVDIPYLMKVNSIREDMYKLELAKKCQKILRDDMVVFIDSSTTCLYLVDTLNSFKGLTIITNGLISASVFSDQTNAQVHCIGGKIFSKRSTIHGTAAYHNIFNYMADLSLISCRGFSLEKGAGESNEDEAYMKKGFCEQAKQTVLLLDHRKVGEAFIYPSVQIRDLDMIVTDREMDEQLLEKLEKAGVMVI